MRILLACSLAFNVVFAGVYVWSLERGADRDAITWATRQLDLTPAQQTELAELHRAVRADVRAMVGGLRPAIGDAVRLIRAAKPGDTTHEPPLQAIGAALEFVSSARQFGVEIDALNIGGGFPVAYRDDDAPPSIEAFAEPIVSRLESWPGRIILEPGRSVVADAGALLTTVQYEKFDGQHRLVVVDAGMHTLIRPALYEAYHRVWPVTHTPAGNMRYSAAVAGPICESADFLARDRSLPLLSAGDRLAILDVGAYGFSMASNYNSHPLPAEVLVDGDSCWLIRQRQSLDSLVRDEE